MARCCYPQEYADLFREGEARRTARRYRRRGLRGSARHVTQAVAAAGVEGASILEVGGGVGTIQAQLLLQGASTSVNVELSPNWEATAQRLFAELGLDDRAERRVADFVDVADDLAPADVVVLHRVLCCYPHWQIMLGAAAAKARRVVALTVPVDAWRTRLAIGVGNRLLAVWGRSFRAFVHPPSRMIEVLQDAGFRPLADRSGWAWRTVVMERAPAVAHPTAAGSASVSSAA